MNQFSLQIGIFLFIFVINATPHTSSCCRAFNILFRRKEKEEEPEKL
jgi:hypothetical protein